MDKTRWSHEHSYLKYNESTKPNPKLDLSYSNADFNVFHDRSGATAALADHSGNRFKEGRGSHKVDPASGLPEDGTTLRSYGGYPGHIDFNSRNDGADSHQPHGGAGGNFGLRQSGNVGVLANGTDLIGAFGQFHADSYKNCNTISGTIDPDPLPHYRFRWDLLTMGPQYDGSGWGPEGSPKVQEDHTNMLTYTQQEGELYSRWSCGVDSAYKQGWYPPSFGLFKMKYEDYGTTNSNWKRDKYAFFNLIGQDWSQAFNRGDMFNEWKNLDTHTSAPGAPLTGYEFVPVLGNGPYLGWSRVQATIFPETNTEWYRYGEYRKVSGSWTGNEDTPEILVTDCMSDYGGIENNYYSGNFLQDKIGFTGSEYANYSGYPVAWQSYWPLPGLDPTFNAGQVGTINSMTHYLSQFRYMKQYVSQIGRGAEFDNANDPNHPGQYIGGEIWGPPHHDIYVNAYSYTDGLANHLKAISRPSFVADDGVAHGGPHKFCHDKNKTGYKANINSLDSTLYHDWYVPAIDELMFLKTFIVNNPSHPLASSVTGEAWPGDYNVASNNNIPWLWSSTCRGAFRQFCAFWGNWLYHGSPFVSNHVSFMQEKKTWVTDTAGGLRLFRRVS